MNDIVACRENLDYISDEVCLRLNRICKLFGKESNGNKLLRQKSVLREMRDYSIYTEEYYDWGKYDEGVGEEVEVTSQPCYDGSVVSVINAVFHQLGSNLDSSSTLDSTIPENDLSKLLLKDIVKETLSTIDILISATAVNSAMSANIGTGDTDLLVNSFDMVSVNEKDKQISLVTDVTRELRIKRELKARITDSRRERVVAPLIRLMHNLLVRYAKDSFILRILTDYACRTLPPPDYLLHHPLLANFDSCTSYASSGIFNIEIQDDDNLSNCVVKDIQHSSMANEKKKAVRDDEIKEDLEVEGDEEEESPPNQYSGLGLVKEIIKRCFYFLSTPSMLLQVCVCRLVLLNHFCY